MRDLIGTATPNSCSTLMNGQRSYPLKHEEVCLRGDTFSVSLWNSEPREKAGDTLMSRITWHC